MANLSADDLDQDPQFAQWVSQAQGAMQAGADPIKVNAKLRDMLAKRGYDPNTIHTPIALNDNRDDPATKAVQAYWDTPFITKDTKKEYKGLVTPSVISDSKLVPNSPAPFANVQGGVDHGFENVQGGASTDYHPELTDSYDKAAANAGDNIARAVGGSVQKANAGAALLLGGVPGLKYLTPAAGMSDDALLSAAHDELKAGDEKQSAAQGVPGTIGNVVGGLSGSWLMSPVDEAMEKLNQGKSLTNAELTLLKGSAINASMVGAGKLGSQAAGLLPYLSRAGSQAATGVGLTAADRAIEGEKLSTEDIATNVGGALLGGMGRHETPVKSESKIDLEVPKTGDAAIDAGAEFAKSFMDTKTDNGKIDLSKPFTQNFDPGWRHKDVVPPDTTVNIDKSPLDAVTDMQDALARRAARARENMANAVGPLENAQDISRAAIDEPTPDVIQPEAPANDALRTPEMEQLKSQLQAEQAPETAGMPQQPSGVNVTTNPVDESLMRPSQRKLGKQTLTVDETGATVPVEVAKPKAPVAPQQSLAEAIAAAKEGRAPLASSLSDVRNNEGSAVFSANHNITPDVLQKLSHNNLTGQDFLDSLSHHPHYNNAPEAVSLAREMSARAKEFGGGDAKIAIYDPSNPIHQDIARRAEAHPGSLPLSKSRAMYDTQTHTILINKDVSASTLAHEVNHAVTAKALFAGEEGRLNPEAQKAYSNLQNVFDALKEHIRGKADDIALEKGMQGEKQTVTNARHTAQTYGLTNLHELDSELRSNAVFRAHLKSMKVGDLPIKPGSFHDAIIQKSKSVYQAIVGGLSKMLGLSKEATTAFDHLYGASEDFQRKVNPSERRSFRQEGQAALGRNYVPDTSFLGEQVERRTLAAKATEPGEEGLQKPRSYARQLARQLLTSGGLEPKATAARRARSGTMAEGGAESAQSGNRLAAVVNNDNRADVASALQGDKAAFDKLDPKAKEVVKNEWGNNFDRSIKAAEAIASNPHATPEQIQHAHTIVQAAGKYQTRIYQANEIKGFMADKLKAAAKGDIEAKQSVDVARKYLENQWLPDTNKLPDMSTDRLEELYKFHTALNPDDQYRGMAPADKRAAMAGAIAEKLRNTVNRDGVLDKIVEEAAGLGSKKSGTRQYYSGLRTGSDIYSEIKGVPPELRQFWGEVNEPIARNVATVRKQYSYLANLKAQTDLRNSGLGTIFSDTRNGVHTEALSGEKLGSLQGLFTTPDVARAVDSVFTMNAAAGDLLDASLSDSSGVNMMVNAAHKSLAPVRGLASVAKMATVLGNLGNFANNALGSHLQLLSNGNINPVNYAKGIKMMSGLMLNERKGSMSADVRDAYKYGLVEYSHIQELQGSANADRVAQYIREAAESPNPLKALTTKAKDMAKAGVEGYKELYGAMDLWTKMANWHNELDFQMAHNKAMGNFLSEAEVKQKTADIVNDTNITPSMAPAMLKGLERYGITRFGTYYSEVARTTKNNFYYGMKDFAGGIKDGDAAQALHGMKRIAGASSSVLLQNKQFAGLAKVVAGAMGLAATQMDKDDSRQKYMDKDDFMQSIDPIVLSDPKNPDAGEYVFDLSRPDPYGPITTPIRNMIDAIHNMASGDQKGAKDKAVQAINNVKDMYSVNTMWKAIVNTWQAKRPSIATTAPDYYTGFMKELTGAGLSVNAAHMVLDAIAPIEPKGIVSWLQGSSVDSPGLKDVVRSGMGATPLNLAKDIGGYMGAKANTDIKDARNNYLDLMKQDFESTPERLESAFNDTMKQAAAPYEKLRLAVQAARDQGTRRADVIKLLKSSGVSDDMATTLMHDRPLKVKDLAGDLGADLKKDEIDAMKDGEKKREAIRRFNYNTRQMNALIRHNRSTDIGDL